MDHKELRGASWRLHVLADSIDEAYETSGGEVTEAQKWMEQMLVEDAQSLVDAICSWETELDARDAVCDQEIDRLKRVKDATDQRRKWGRKQLGMILDRLGAKKIETPTRMVIRTNGSKRAEPDTEMPAIDFADPRFVREVPAELQWNKTEILRALKAGEPVDGWHLAIGEKGVTVK